MKDEFADININSNEYQTEMEESLSLRFNSLAKKILLQGNELSAQLLIKKANKFYSLIRGYSDYEFFLELKRAYLFWQFNSPLNKAVKDSLKLNSASNSENSALSGLNELFIKWSLSNSAEEKEVLAKLIIELIDKKKYLKNFLSLVFKSAVHIYSKLYFDPSAAVDLLFQAADYTHRLNITNEQKEELNYYLQLFRGFAQYYDQQYEAASHEFEKASLEGKSKTNAKFYKALTDIKLLNYDSASSIIKNLFDLEIERFADAIKNKNRVLFRLAVEENIIRNIFLYEEFAQLTEYIEYELTTRSESADQLYKMLKSKLVDIGHIDFTVKLDEKLFSGIKFIRSTISEHSKADPVFLMTIKLFEEFFNDEVNLIIEFIDQKYESDISEKLLLFDNEIEESTKAIIQLEREIETSKQNIKKKYESVVKSYNDEINAAIDTYEGKIKEVDNSKRYDPAEGLKSGLMYNIFFTVIIFLVICFASYTNYNAEAKDFKEALSPVLILGLKWALITFLIGLLFTFFSILGSIMEKNRLKKRYMNKIDYLSQKKESDVKQMQKEMEEMQETVIKKWKQKIALHESRIEQVKKERQIKEEEIRKETDKTKQSEITPLRNLLTLYSG